METRQVTLYRDDFPQGMTFIFDTPEAERKAREDGWKEARETVPAIAARLAALEESYMVLHEAQRVMASQLRPAVSDVEQMRTALTTLLKALDQST